MPNVLPTPVIIADKMLEFLFEASGIINDVNRDYESEFEHTPNSIGRIVQVKNPPRFVSQSGPAISTVQSTNFGLSPFAIDKWRTVPIKLTGLEKTFNNAKELDLWAEKNLKPMVAPLVADIESDIFGLYHKVANHVGTAGTGTTTVDPIAAAMEKLNYYETPQDERVCYLNPTAARRFLSGITTFSNSGGTFNPQQEIGKMFMSGQILPSVSGFQMRTSNKVANHTAGPTINTNAQVNGVDVVGTSVAFDTAALSLKKGDVVTFAGVYAVNPITKASTGQLRQFTLTADCTSTPLLISPAVIPSGAFQNITGATGALAGIPDNAVITVMTSVTASLTYAQNLAFWKKAIGLVTVPIAPLEGMKSVTRTVDGISLTFTTGGDIMNYETIKRIDLAYGVDIFQGYQDQIVRITN